MGHWLALGHRFSPLDQLAARRALLPDFSPRRPGVLSVSEVTLADNPQNYAYMERESTSYLFEMKGMR